MSGYLPGDLNGDGKVNTADAILTLRYAVRLESFDSGRVAASDLNADGILDCGDAVLIQRAGVGLPINPPQPGEDKNAPRAPSLHPRSGENETVTVSTPITHATLGSSFVVPIMIENADGFAGCDLLLRFPRGLMTLTGIERGELTEDFELEYHETDDGLRISMSNKEAASAGTGEVARLVFVLSEGGVPSFNQLVLVFIDAEIKEQFGGSLRWHSEITTNAAFVQVDTPFGCFGLAISDRPTRSDARRMILPMAALFLATFAIRRRSMAAARIAVLKRGDFGNCHRALMEERRSSERSCS